MYDCKKPNDCQNECINIARFDTEALQTLSIELTSPDALPAGTEDFLAKINHIFKEEFHLYITDKGNNGRTGEEELNRTKSALLSLYWLLANDYASFTECQKNGKLTRKTFQTASAKVRSVLNDPESIKTMLVLMAIHDLGKTENFQELSRNAMALNTFDHDLILLQGLKHRPELLPAFQALRPDQKEMIIQGFETGFNFPQFVQLECPPQSLENFIRLPNLQIKEFFLLHCIFDVAGASGHFKGSAVMTEQTMNSFFLAYEALLGTDDYNDAYQKFVKAKSEQLDIKRAIEKELGSPENFSKISLAVTRLATMARCNLQETEELILVFGSITPEIREILIDELNRSGCPDNPATLIYYAPELFLNAKKAVQEKYDGNLAQSLRHTLNILASVFQHVQQDRDASRIRGNFTINVFYLADQIKQNGPHAPLNYSIRYIPDENGGFQEGKVIPLNIEDEKSSTNLLKIMSKAKIKLATTIAAAASLGAALIA